MSDPSCRSSPASQPERPVCRASTLSRNRVRVDGGSAARESGTSGVWFFSLDAARLGAVVTARCTYRLPYFWSKMSIERSGSTISYQSSRRLAAASRLAGRSRRHVGRRRRAVAAAGCPAGALRALGEGPNRLADQGPTLRLTGECFRPERVRYGCSTQSASRSATRRCSGMRSAPMILSIQACTCQMRRSW